MSEKPSPCECISRLREFKNQALFDFWERVRIPEPGPFGVFGIEVPTEEEMKEALEGLRDSLEHYSKECPWKLTPEARELAEALEKVTTDVATLRAVLSGVYEWTLGDLIVKAEMFMVSAVEGLYETTEGPKSVKGPLSPDQYTRHKCTACLNNLDAAKREIVSKAEDAKGYMSAPESLITEMDELNETQRELYANYISVCKIEPLNLKAELEGVANQKDRDKEHLGRFDEWTREHEEELKVDPEKWRDRMSGREHWLWEIEKDISDHQNPINVFLETEWSNVCGNLKWKKK